MTTQHTPGPWLRTQGSGRFYIKTDDETSQSLATVFSNKGDFGCISNPDYEKAKANARLIAAAPELLEACQTFSEWLRREDEGWVSANKDRSTPEGEAAWREWFYENLRICNLAQDQVKAAIAKATGEQA